MKRMSYPVDPFPVGLDVGHSNVKYVSPWQQGRFESVYALEVPGINFEGLATSDDLVITTPNEKQQMQRIAIGATTVSHIGSIPVQTLDPSRVLSVDYTILTRAALAVAMRGADSTPFDGVVAPVFNLPISWYERREEVKRHLAGQHIVGFQGVELEFILQPENMRMLPEGFATLCREMIDETGDICNDEYNDSTVGVVDLGMQTTDLSFYDKLVFVKAKSRGFNVGLRQALEIAQQRGQLELGYTFSLEQIDRAVNGLDRLFVGNQDVTSDVLDWFSQGMAQVTNSVIGHIRSMWQSGNDARHMLLAGGTTVHAADMLMATFKQSYMVANPAMSNAEGAMRYGLMKVRETYA